MYPNNQTPNPDQRSIQSYPGQNQMPTYTGQGRPSYSGQFPSNPVPPYHGQMPSRMPPSPGQNQASYRGQMPNPNQRLPSIQPYRPGAYVLPIMNRAVQHDNYSQRQSGGRAYQLQQLATILQRPTLTQFSNFDASNDAAALRRAMELDTDENAIINVLCRRPSAQRMEIVKAYKTAYGRDLVADIKRETSNNFQRLLLALLTPMIQYYCQELSEAMRSEGTEALIEILCGGLPNRTIHAITAEYKRLYGQPLEEGLKSETSLSFKRLLVSCATGNRDESMITNVKTARNDAYLLIGVRDDEREFNRIFCTRNFAQLKLIAQEYYISNGGKTLERAIKKEFSGDYEDGLIAVLHCALNRSQFFAKCLHKSIGGLGTDDRTLIRLCVTRCERDMMDIKEEYERTYKEPLKAAIQDDTLGHYRHALHALIGEHGSD